MSIKVDKDAADQEQFDATSVTGLDPNLHYRWVRKDPVNMTRQQAKGYEVVEKSDKIKHILDAGTKIKKGTDASTSMEWGDMILMSTPRERFEERLARKRAKIVRQTKGVTQTYKEAIARMSRSGGQEPLGFEEHKENAAGYRDAMTEKDVAAELDKEPYNEGRRIGVR